MGKEIEKVDSLEQALLNAGVDLTYEKPKLFDMEEGLVGASDAWTNNEKGIRAVLESRASELRHKILFTCTPVELPALRERLVELSQVIRSFKDAVVETERRAKQREEQGDQSADADAEVEEVTDDKSSM